MKKHVAFLLAAIMACDIVTARAANPEKLFLQSIEGEWKGPGEVVAGKYKGTKFTCTFSGIAGIAATGMTLDGTCRSGIFSQSMQARFVRNADSYAGTFNNGAQARGLDMTAGKIRKDHITFNLERERFSGTMTAHLTGSNLMNITLTVRIEEQMIPLIDMKLARTGPAPIRRLAKN